MKKKLKLKPREDAGTVMRRQWERDQALLKTPEGRRAREMRDAAQVLASENRYTEAHELFFEAVELFTSGDNSGSAAAARFDLAEFYLDLDSGDPLENALQAERLFRWALSSSERRADPYRRAISEDGLARCLRRLAQLERGCSDNTKANGPRLMDEAEQLALAATRSIKPAGEAYAGIAAGLWSNLGCVRAERGNRDGAIWAYRQAVQSWKSGRDIADLDHHWSGRKAAATALINWAGMLLANPRDDDIGAALELLRESWSLEVPPCNSHARLTAAELLRERGQIDEARRLLDVVDPNALHHEGLLHLGVLLRSFGETAAATRILGLTFRAALDRWCYSSTLAHGDLAAIQAQQAASEAARISCELNDPTLAFAWLSAAHGLRFDDAYKTHVWRPSDPFAREIMNHSKFCGTASNSLASLASLASKIPEPKACIEDALALAGEREQRLGVTDALQHARASADPVGRLVREAIRLQWRSFKLAEQADELDPISAAARQTVSFPLRDGADLVNVLQAWPEHVLLHVHVSRDILAIGVWLDNGELRSAYVRYEIPPGLEKLPRAAEGDPCAGAEVGNALRALDLSPALPAERKDRCVVFASYQAAQLPILAFGPVGHSLLDRFNSVVVLPSISVLRQAPAPTPPRQGRLIVRANDVRFADLASHNLAGCSLSGAEATPHNVVTASATVAEAVFYGHGHVTKEDGPGLELEGGRLHAGNLDETSGEHLESIWEGMERVELWACESALNVPNDPFGSPVDDVLGLDGLFLTHGVRTTVGALWRANAFVTACIARKFHSEIESEIAPDRALTRTILWWRDSAGPRFAALVREERHERRAIDHFLVEQGWEVNAGDLETDLGPRTDEPLSTMDIEARIAFITGSSTWGAYRFVGIPGRSPARPWTDDDERTLTEEEECRLGKVLEGDRGNRTR